MHILYRESKRPVLPFSRREALDDLPNSALIKYGILKRTQFSSFHTIRAWLPPLGFFISKWQDIEADDFSDGPVWMGFVSRDAMPEPDFRSDICGTEKGWEALAASFSTTTRQPGSLERALREFFVAKPWGLTELSGHQCMTLEASLRAVVRDGLLPHPIFRSRRAREGDAVRTLPPPTGLAVDQGTGICPAEFLS